MFSQFLLHILNRPGHEGDTALTVHLIDEPYLILCGDVFELSFSWPSGYDPGRFHLYEYRSAVGKYARYVRLATEVIGMIASAEELVLSVVEAFHVHFNPKASVER